MKQLNVKNTVFILKFLQESDIKNTGDENIELNMQGMMDKMLEDFTIDYTFCYKKKDYIIRLPYKSTDNFENGYVHSDLQLGKLSIIGIYRDEINFDEKDNISSKFLEFVSESYEDQLNKTPNIKLKESNSINQETLLDFEYEKLKGTYKLIDVISIVQEININRKG